MHFPLLNKTAGAPTATRVALFVSILSAQPKKAGDPCEDCCNIATLLVPAGGSVGNCSAKREGVQLQCNCCIGLHSRCALQVIHNMSRYKHDLHRGRAAPLCDRFLRE